MQLAINYIKIVKENGERKTTTAISKFVLLRTMETIENRDEEKIRLDLV